MITGIVLAAGKGSRFGGDKMLHLIKQENGTHIPMGLLSALNLKPWVDQVICVVRPHDDALINMYQQYGFNVHKSEHYQQGLSASLVAGVKASMKASAWVIALGDMPFIKSSSYEKMRETLKSAAKGHIIQLTHNNKPGHPVVFPKRFKNDLLALQGDVGARSIVQREGEKIVSVEVADASIHLDIDYR
jgi:molybdenum cofactor cytidylyltransferase